MLLFLFSKKRSSVSRSKFYFSIKQYILLSQNIVYSRQYLEHTGSPKQLNFATKARFKVSVISYLKSEELFEQFAMLRNIYKI